MSPLIGNPYTIGDTTSNFKLLDDISSYTWTFNGSSSGVVSLTNNTLTLNAYRFANVQRVTYTNGGGTSIGGLTSGNAYYIVKVDTNTFKLALTYSNALSNNTIDLTSLGVGSVHTITAAFDGINTKFKATYNNGIKAAIANAAQLTISINGVIQRPYQTGTPTGGYSIEDGNTIVFFTAPSVSDAFWGNIIANSFPTYDISDNAIDTFVGNASQTNFTLSQRVPNNESLLVTINGITQYPSDTNTVRSYNVYDNILGFTTAPGSGASIQARHLGFAGAVTSSTPVTAFYGRTGNVVLTNNDDITVRSISSITQLNVSGVSTFTTGPVIIGAATSTGTASQPLQVTGGAYVSGNLGIGTTNPSYNIDVTGSVGITTTSGDALLLSSTLSNARTSIVLNTNGNDWELGSRGSGSSPINSFYIYDRNSSAYRQVIDPSGNVLLGGATATTGTASQPLQVTGGAYVSSSVGIGVTNPTNTLTVVGSGTSTSQLYVVGVSTLAGKIVSGNQIGNTNISNTLNYSSSSGINAFRPISLVDSAAGIKISRNAGQTNGAALELQTWDVGIVTNYSYWDVNAENGYFGIRDRKNSRSRIFIDDSGSILLGANSATFSNNYSELVGIGTDKVLNVLGSSYVSGSVGIGTTNPTSKLTVTGDALVSGVVTATTFYGTFSGNASSSTYATSSGIATYATSSGIATYATSSGIATYATSSGIATNVIGGIGSITQLQVTGISTFTNGPVLVGTSSSTGTASQPLQVTGGAYVSGNLGIGTTNPAAILDVRGTPWFSPNTTGVKATALRLGRFTDGANAAYDIITDDNTGDDIEIQSNRYTGQLKFSRSSPSGIQTTFAFYSHYQIGSYISIADTTGTTTKIKLDEAANTFFNNSGAVLVGTISSTGTASQRLQVTGGAYVSGNLGIGTTNPTVALQLSPNAHISNLNSTTNFGTTVGAAATVAQFLHTNGNSSILRIKATRNSTGTDWTTASTKLLQVIDVTEMGYIEYNPNGANYGMAFGQGGSEWARFLSNGNLGVGITNPTQTLHVQGSARVTGSVYDFNNAAGSTGQILQSVGTGVSWTTLSGGATLTNDTTTNASYYPTFSSATSGTYSTAYVSNTKCTFNPSTGTLSATAFSGSGANLTSLNASNLSSGTVPVTLLGSSGTRDATTYLRGDNTWATISGGATLNNSPSGTLYPTMSSGTSGTYSTAYVSSTALTFTTSTGTLSATQFTSLSDANKKKNIRPIENAIEITKKLEGVRFDWKDNDAPSIGVIAQEVEKVLPELVVENDGTKSVSYGNIVGVLIEAIKEQQVRIEELERKLK